ncbi:MAG: pilus assembly PilX N-terminal domain-containing protein [Luteolibacter sp.]
MKTNPQKPWDSGFALIVTLSLMILLTVVAVGLLSLSSISMRSTSQGSAQAVAQANARLALMLAIGDLQKSMGPDQRISASASVFNATAPQPNVVGAWTSLGWKGPTGAAPSPGDKSAKFRGWLVSSRDLAAVADFGFANKAPSADAIWLANPATTGTITTNNLGHPDASTPTMKAERVPVTAGKAVGGLAWMVSDNSTKVSLNLKSTNSVQLAENIANRTSPTSPRPDVVNDVFDKITEPGRMISMQTAVLAVGSTNKKEVVARSQSLTVSSLGLLTNPVAGGLKTDLTPLLESSSADLTSALGAANPYFPVTSSSSTGDGAPSWNFLRSHYQLYKRVSGQSAGVPRFKLAMDNDIIPTSSGIQSKPAKEVLLPVISKLQIMFSLVSHHSHISDRMQALATQPTDPKDRDNLKHAVPHLVYDPVITLYNPYDVELQLDQLRIRVSDPPVGFQFQKHDLTAGTNPWYRPEFASGEFHGLGRFQIAKEHDPSARKTFTFYLRNKTASGTPGGAIILLPGEVKVFSAWVEKSWTWGLEVGAGDGMHPRSFFDWDINNNMGNIDKRTYDAGTNPTGTGRLGVEAIPGLDWRAGLQTDHMSYANGRGADSKYSWEAAPLGAGWLSMKLADSVTVNAKPVRCLPPSDTTSPDFKVDILAGKNDTAETDILRTYEFRLKDVATEMSTTSTPSKVITRKFRNSDILQAPADDTPGGKSPFAIFTMSAKTTKDPRDDSKAWVFNNMVTEGGLHDSRKIGNAAQSYDLRLEEVRDFTSFPGVEYDDKKQRGYFGAIANASQGVSVVPMYRVPLTPAASLGDWIASNLVTSSQFPRANSPLGNSFANPLVPSDRISATSPMGTANALDHSYLLNASLWDSFYFSTACNYSGAAFSTTRQKTDVLEKFFNGQKPMLNQRLVPYLADSGDAKALSTKYSGMADLAFSKGFAKNAMIDGAFNINSDSVDAWRAVLSSLRDASVKGYTNQNIPVNDKTAFVRNGLPVAGSADDASPANSVNALGQIRWAGFRALSDDQIENLATLIVAEIRARGNLDSAPSLCLADFVNRRIGSSTSLHALKGILQTAIDKSKINDNPGFHGKDSNTINAGSLAADRIVGLLNKEALNGFTADGAAPMLTQGDLLTGLAPIITARGDTFTIRSYGECRTTNGTSVVARAWCEATVQRVPAFVDGANAPEAVSTTLSPVNVSFGRRFVVTSFRWLNASEI